MITAPAHRRLLLDEIYGPGVAAEVGQDLEAVVDSHRRGESRPAGSWSQADAWLITYPDQFQAANESPLQTLHRFFASHFSPWLNGLHVLPFYPWSSDDGFSVIDYEQVDPRYGSWTDIEQLGRNHRLGVDAVLNHMSAESAWFGAFLEDAPGHAGFFATAGPDDDLSTVIRPRTSPLLTTFASPRGPVDVWTTFSADQVDLNWSNPQVLLRMVDVILGYARRGAGFIRLDAVGLLWKEPGTTSQNLPETHKLVALLRSAVEAAYPGVWLLTETNVPHEENVAYFGSASRPEAHLVYQFPLAPLVLAAFASGDGTHLAEWLSALPAPLPSSTFLNFLASHDGVGLRPLEGLVAAGTLPALLELTEEAGGAISFRSAASGGEEPYELNSSWFDLMAAGYSEQAGIARHLATHALLLALPGIPAIYVHSLFGSSNDQEGYRETGRARSLNRKKFTDLGRLERRLTDPLSREHAVSNGIGEMVRRRSAHPAFHPGTALRVLELPHQVLGIERAGPDGSALVLTNVGEERFVVELDDTYREMGGSGAASRRWTLEPWQNRWLER